MPPETTAGCDTASQTGGAKGGAWSCNGGESTHMLGPEGGAPDGVTATSESLGSMGSPDEGGPAPGEVKGQKRETWSRQIDFLLACIGFSVGLGNVWRFPYLCYKNGGGAFLLPYFVCVVLGGIPLFYLEVALGQFMSMGGISVWNICPLFRGIGYATTIIVFLLNIYYNVILAWAFYYLFSSFTGELPWSSCKNEWNTARCLRSIRDLLPVNGSSAGGNATPSTGLDLTYNNGTGDVMNWTQFLGNASLSNASLGYVDPATEFWERKVLQISDGLDDVRGIKWDLALCLLLAWVVVYLCIWKGIKSSGKVMYFTATTPYILMTVLLVRGVTLPGAIDGIRFYLIPVWEKLAEPQVWVDAGTQIFFSYSISVGALTALGSYNKWNHNCWRDSVIFACVNSGTSFFAGFVIFSTLGFMAHEQGVDVGDVAESGPGLAFIAYPKAVSQMPVAPLWSILFFIMIILLGLDSQFVGVEGFVTAIVDECPELLRSRRRRPIFIAVVCIVSFFIGLSMVTHGGMYVFQLFDYYSGSRIILVVAFFECLVVAWIYGVHRFYDNMQMMMGFRISPYMRVCWSFLSPTFVAIIFGLCVYSYSELTYNRTYVYPSWGIGLGWMLACCSVTMIPVVIAFRLIREKGTFRQRLRLQLRPRLQPHQLRPDDDPKDLADYPHAQLYDLEVKADLEVKVDLMRQPNLPDFTCGAEVTAAKT